MKTVCIALVLVFVHVASSSQDPAPENLIFHSPGENATGPLSMKHPEDPAKNRFKTILFNPDCPDEGYFRDPYNCGKFYQCKTRGAVPLAWYCSPGFIFNVNTDWCDFPENVEC